MTFLRFVSPVSLLTHTTNHPPLSPLSDNKLQHLILVPFFFFSPLFNKHRGRSTKESALAGDRNALFGSRFGVPHPAEPGSQAGDRPERCLSKWARKSILSVAAGAHHSCHRNICTQPGLEVGSGSGGRLGKWPMSLSRLPMFPFGERDSWLSTARDGSGERWCSLIPRAAHPRRC